MFVSLGKMVEFTLIYVRVAGQDGRIYLDLCDRDWRAVEIAADGWRIINGHRTVWTQIS